MSPRLFVRADGSASHGLGHLMRSLAIAQVAVARGIPVTYVSVADPALSVLEHRGLEVLPLSTPDSLDWTERVSSDDIVVVDGYDDSEQARRRIRSTGARVGLVEDRRGSSIREADVVIAPALMPRDLEVPAGSVLVHGAEAALVRAEFRRRRRRRLESRSVVVVMGGSDVSGLTGTLATGILEASPNARVTAVFGPAARAEPLPSRPRLRVVRTPPDPAEVFDRASFAVVTGSTVAWEFLTMGSPVVIVEVADNQQSTAEFIADSGLGIRVGRPGPELADRVAAAVVGLSRERLGERSQRVLDVVDGLGAERALNLLLRGTGGRGASLAPRPPH